MDGETHNTKVILEKIAESRLAVAKDMGEVKTTIARIEAGCKPCQRQVEHVTKALDGRDGLVAGHATLRSTVQDHIKRGTVRDAAIVSLLTIVIAAVLISLM